MLSGSALGPVTKAVSSEPKHWLMFATCFVLVNVALNIVDYGLSMSLAFPYLECLLIVSNILIAAGEGHGKGKTGTVLRTDSFTKDGRPPSDSLSLSELSCDPQSSTSVPLDTSLAGPQSSAPMQQSFPSLGLATSASPVPVPVNKIPPPTSKVTPSSPSSINPSLTHVSPSQSPIRGSLPSAPLSNGPFTSSPMPHPQPSRRIQSIASSIRPRSVPLPLRAQSPEHFKRSKSENSIQNVCLSDSPLKLQPLDSTNRAQGMPLHFLENELYK